MPAATSTRDGKRRRTAVAGRIRLGYLVSHPIQYQAPLLREISTEPGIDLRVLFLSDFSTRSYHDAEFGVAVDWDVPLIEGYAHRFLSSAVPGRFRPVVADLNARIDEERLDALWVHGYAHHACLRAIRHARRRGIPVLLRGESTLREARAGWKSAALRRLFASVAAFLAVGRRNREYYLAHGASPEKIFDVPYAVDNERFRSADDNDVRRLRRDLGLDEGRPVALFAAKLIDRKRPADVLRAFGRLEGSARPYLLLAGDGEQRVSLERAAARFGPDVRFLGFQNQRALPALYHLADLFVLPSAHEQYGLAVNEAMAAGLPVIASDAVGASEDLIDDGVTGFVVPVGDVGAIAERMRALLFDPARRRAMGLAASNKVATYDLASARDGVVAAVESVTTGARR